MFYPCVVGLVLSDKRLTVPRVALSRPRFCARGLGQIQRGTVCSAFRELTARLSEAYVSIMRILERDALSIFTDL
jgi:hypothetical protein